MPVAERGGNEIYYEVRGRGPPLLLIEGLGYGLWMWRGQSPSLEDRFRLLLVDNRGVGKSTPLPGPYSMAEFARDAVAVLDQEGVERAAVLGASMGGMIAQSIADLFPARVTALVLACTLAGGVGTRPMPAETWAEVTRQVPGESERDRLRRTMAVAMTPDYPRVHPTEIDRILDDRIAAPTDGAQWMYQAQSAREFDARGSDARLGVPVLLTTGTDDRVVPWTNSLALFHIIPRSSLRIFRGQNHLHFLERATEFNEAVARFLTAPPGEFVAGRVDEVI